jgi:hypothetical protein
MANIQLKGRITESGELEIEIPEGMPPGEVIVTIETVHDSEQAWFWTPEWQAGEREADEDIKVGRYKDFSTMDDLLNDLNDEDK